MRLATAISLFFGVIFASIVASNYYALSVYEKAIKEHTAQSVDSVSADLIVAIENMLNGQNSAQIQKLLDRTAHTKEFISSISLSLDGKIYAFSSNRALVSLPVKKEIRQLTKKDSSAKELAKDEYNIGYTIEYYEDGAPKKAFLHLILNRQKIFENVERQSIEINQNIAVAQILIAALLLFIIYLSFIKPFNKITQTAQNRFGTKEPMLIKEMSDLNNTLIDSFESLKNQNTTLRTLLQTIPDLVWLKDERGVYRFCNPAFEGFFGDTQKNIVGKTDYDFVDKELADFFRQKDVEAMQKDEPSTNIEWVTLAKSQKRVLLETIKTKVLDINGNVIGILGISRDITALWESKEELKRYSLELEEMVREETKKRVENERLLIGQSKMAAMGEMLTAVAHNWRQPLNALAISIQDIREAYKANEITKEYIEDTVSKSMSYINSMSKTIDLFRNYITTDKSVRSFKADEMFQEIFNIYKAELDTLGIECKIEKSEVSEITTFENSLKQVVSEIFLNAKDALYDKIKSDKSFRPTITFSSKKSGEAISVCIQNNGGSINEDVLDRIYEPYYTTKEQGKGVGLGLYTAKLIVEKKLNGKIEIKNISEDSVRFCITIPNSI